MPRRARAPIAAAAVAALVGVLTWASVSQAEAPPVSPASSSIVDPNHLRSTLAPIAMSSIAMSSTVAPSTVAAPKAANADARVRSAELGTAVSASSVPTTTLPRTPPAASTTTIADLAGNAPPSGTIRPEIGEPLAVLPGGSVAPADPATPAAPAGSESPTDAAPPSATPAPPVSPVGVGGAATAGRAALANPGPLSPNQIDRITIAATPTALRDLLTVSVVFLGAGNIELDHARFSIRFVGTGQRSQSYDATVPNGTLTLAITWTTVAGPIAIDDLSVLVVGVAPPTGLQT